MKYLYFQPPNNIVKFGFYILADNSPDKKADVVIIVTGSEVSVGLATQERLQQKILDLA